MIMGSKAKVSIIVPVYNVEDYLPRCLESCINQSLYDIEIICVDDGSTDDSGKILDTYALIDRRIRVIHKTNGGLASARNAGMLVANSEWIMFLDSDDYFSLNACERVWVEAQDAPTDIIIFGTNIFPVYPDIPHWYKFVLHTEAKRFNKFEPKVLFSTRGAKPFVWRQAFSSNFIENNKLLFDDDARYGEDLIFQFKAFPVANKFTFIEDKLYNYRLVRKGSLMSKANKDLDYKMLQHLKMVEKITEYWNEKALLSIYGVNYLSWLLDFMVPDLYRYELTDKAFYANELKNIINKYDLLQYKKELKKELLEQWYRLEKL